LAGCSDVPGTHEDATLLMMPVATANT
jgi:hypothetical protein